MNAELNIQKYQFSCSHSTGCNIFRPISRTGLHLIKAAPMWNIIFTGLSLIRINHTDKLYFRGLSLKYARPELGKS